ncbi:E3 ubiquitin-protein ligase RNF128-like isoform X2 [Conger conger]|uniref:E3 ubiquitin-protein ligase RNF128-like isoform X2 n=1 Tax=Conger conger TaxID=82655 RepID=UPI002A5B02DB|nr:E3 ubiquitin-protein ligase RNF128-like isoform X2 [Conger conger]
MGLETRRLFSLFFVAFCLIVSSLRSAQAAYLYTAFVNVSYVDSHNATVWERKESGLYGQDSPKTSVAGSVILPKPIHGCETDSFSDIHSNAKGWIALILRGHGCTFSDKIKIAASNGAIAAVIFNEADTGYSVIQMAHPGTRDTVAIMIGNSWGMEIVKLIKSGVRVSMEITVGNPHGPWMSQYSLILVSLSFFVVTAVTVGYFIFHSARRLYSARAHIRRQKQLKDEAKKAIGQLQVRTLQHGDQETGPEADTCAVCIDAYKPGDVVSILTCSHFFHKTCIEPWLLEHRTCPMCKCDILKSLGIELEGGEEPEDHGNGLQVSVVPDSQTLPTATSGIEIDRRSETASSGYASVHESEGLPSGAQTPSNMPHQNRHNPTDDEGVQVGGSPVYDNLAFEGDTQSPLEVKS